jgi:hypothetical protein
VTANSANVTYNGQQQSVNGFTASGLVNGETETVLTGVSTSGGSGRNVGSYTHTASGTDGNYDLSFVDGTLTVTAAPTPVEPPISPVVPPSAGAIYRDSIQSSGSPADMGQPHDLNSLMANYTPSLQPIGEGNGFPGMGSAFVTLAPGYVPFAPGVEGTAIALGDPPAADTAAADTAVDRDGEERAKRRRGRR